MIRNRVFLALFSALALSLALFPAPASGADGLAGHEGHAGVQPLPFPAENVFNPPAKALVSPHEARLENSAYAEIGDVDGQRAVSFILPAQASNLELRIPGQTIVRWISEPCALKAESRHSTLRKKLENDRISLAAQLATQKARLDVWKMQAPSAGAQDIAQRQSLMEQAMPGLAQSVENLQNRLKVVDEELARMPAPGAVGKKITAFLTGGSSKERGARLEYSYNIPSCGWSAVYEFNARPDGVKGDVVDVRLLAEVWQYTGMDWSGTEITLATRGSGPREPRPLPRWVIGDKPKPESKPVVMSARAKDAHAAEASVANIQMAPPPAAHVSGDTDSMYASWKLSAKGLPEGRSRLEILSDAWQAPLRWLARPVVGDDRVWLYAKYTLPPHQGWPEGAAQYSVDNQNVGDGYFTPSGGEATLYFGADPRVRIKTTADSSKQGESGIINTNKTWTWAWTYTLTNTHNTPVKVKVERPAPMIMRENVRVSYNDKPAAIKDEKEHMLYWDADVPADGKFEIQHGVTITAPVTLELLPDIP